MDFIDDEDSVESDTETECDQDNVKETHSVCVEVRPICGAILYCHINAVVNDMAYITMTNGIGLSSFAECKRRMLKAYGVTNKFDIVISSNHMTIDVVLRVGDKEWPLGECEREFMWETIDQVISDNKMSGNSARAKELAKQEERKNRRPVLERGRHRT